MEKLIAAPALVNVTVLLPRLIVRVLLLLDDRDAAVTLKLLVVKVPLVCVIFETSVKASCSVHVAVLAPDTPNIRPAPNVFPADVTVYEPLVA